MLISTTTMTSCTVFLFYISIFQAGNVLLSSRENRQPESSCERSNWENSHVQRKFDCLQATVTTVLEVRLEFYVPQLTSLIVFKFLLKILYLRAEYKHIYHKTWQNWELPREQVVFGSCAKVEMSNMCLWEWWQDNTVLYRLFHSTRGLWSAL